MRSLIPWRRRRDSRLESFQREMEDLFQQFLDPLEGNGPKALGLDAWTPRVDIEESEKEIMVKADLPGVDVKDVEVSVLDGSLILCGEKKEEKKEEKKDYHRVERFQGQFYREIPLPPVADPNKISATYSQGVVTITVPKKPGVQPRKVLVTQQD